MLTNDSKPTCGILYIDDEEKALKYFRMAFSEKYKVFTATSGKEGLEILRRESKNIGIVISDQRMPEMLGAEILSIVRNEFPSIVRVLTTAYSDLDSAIQAVNQGHIYQYVVKPWEIPDLKMVLQRAADYYQVLAERNELLALKMSTLQRIVCSDRLKWLLLVSRYWDAVSQASLRRVLLALIQALPESPSQFLAGAAALSARHFEIGGLIRGEFHNGAHCLDLIDQARSVQAASGASLQAFGAAIAERYQLSQAQAALSLSGTEARLELNPPENFPVEDFLKTLFGVLLERDTDRLSLLLVESLLASASTNGSLTIAGPGSLSLSFSLPATAPSPDEIIDALTAKFSAWDISRL